jgi:hypothetical protein
MQPESRIPARHLLWTYWGLSEEAVDKEFYVTLQLIVADELRRNWRPNDRLWVGREMQLKVGRYPIRARLVNLDPPLATLLEGSTEIAVRYQPHLRGERQDISSFVAEIIRYPNSRLGETYESLVGIDEIKEDMLRKLRFLLNPQRIDRWFRSNYNAELPRQLLQIVRDRYPLIILEGEVGAGKTALARGIGHPLSQALGTTVALFVVNAQVRGGGHVGELTQNISRAFDEAERAHQQEQIPVLLLIDEADALAQARGTPLTHHEDDAGVNTLIQRIDKLRGRSMAVIFATNLFQSLDSAILRRATAAFHFHRPTFAQRVQVFRTLLLPLSINEQECEQLAIETDPRSIAGFEQLYHRAGETDPHSTQWQLYHRYTYSDLTQRLIPYAIEQAAEDQQPLDYDLLLKACQAMGPTPEAPQADPRLIKDLVSYFHPEAKKRRAVSGSYETTIDSSGDITKALRKHRADQTS